MQELTGVKVAEGEKVRFWVYSEGGAAVEALDMGGEGNKDMKDGLALRWPLGAESIRARPESESPGERDKAQA